MRGGAQVCAEGCCAPALVQPAAEAIATELAHQARAQRLRGAHEGWARVLALLLAAAQQLPGESQPQRLPAHWQPVLVEALAEALRWVQLPDPAVEAASDSVCLQVLVMHHGEQAVENECTRIEFPGSITALGRHRSLAVRHVHCLTQSCHHTPDMASEKDWLAPDACTSLRLTSESVICRPPFRHGLIGV